MTTYTTRPVINTSWGSKRLGGGYLCDIDGNYIKDIEGNRIIVIIEGGTLPTTLWNIRPSIIYKDLGNLITQDGRLNNNEGRRIKFHTGIFTNK